MDHGVVMNHHHLDFNHHVLIQCIFIEGGGLIFKSSSLAQTTLLKLQILDARPVGLLWGLLVAWCGG